MESLGLCKHFILYYIFYSLIYFLVSLLTLMSKLSYIWQSDKGLLYPFDMSESFFKYFISGTVRFSRPIFSFLTQSAISSKILNF